MRKNIIVSLALFACLFLFNLPVFATNFTISGRVATSYDDSNNGIENALITFSPHGNNPPYPSYYAFSDSDGYFSIAIPRNGEPGFHYHVFCQRSPYSFADDLTYEADGGFYFVPL
jgi:hypothetical protein